MEFALLHFNPYCMKFSGFLVEAESIGVAASHYLSSVVSSNVFVAVEPNATKIKAEMIKSQNITNEDLNRIAIKELSDSIDVLFYELNNQFSEMAMRLRQISDNHPEITIEQLYDTFRKSKFSEFSREYKFRAPGDDV